MTSGTTPPAAGRGSVSAGFTDHLFRHAVAQGADPAILARRAGLRVEMLGNPDRRIPLAQYMALMRAAQDLCRSPSLALHVGAARDFREFSIAGLICYAAPTMGEALRQLNRYGRLAMDVQLPQVGPRFQLVPRADGLWLVDGRADPNAFPELTESTWSRFIAETARHFPHAAFAQEVHVTHARPAYGDLCAALWKVPVVFDAAWNAIRIDPSWLNIPLHNPSQYAFGILSAHADTLLAELESARTARGRVEAALLPILHTGDGGMDRVAAALGLSRQSLYRQLKAEGTRFDAVLDGLRFRLAVAYLMGRKASVNEVAYLVGFSEPSAFSRAFKRWTGVSPRHYQPHAGQAGPDA
ncbi:AraC family transcriptional regulator [Nitrospirillum amazonense]|uniref:AraC family transcriptional regulator n=1 Tax=Nitrospirillum amazonense TaxID=28077 RepID=A0A560EUF6_9PROT|nr:AraC family transcriptional regulator [Nitrospirillum amazonense]TWB12986.1 AraC family transcriptional regulator [Nitrospirillum amazonense]